MIILLVLFPVRVSYPPQKPGYASASSGNGHKAVTDTPKPPNRLGGKINQFVVHLGRLPSPSRKSPDTASNCSSSRIYYVVVALLKYHLLHIVSPFLLFLF